VCNPNIRPNKVNDAVTASHISMASTGLRMTADQTSGKYFMLNEEPNQAGRYSLCLFSGEQRESLSPNAIIVTHIAVE